jgi:hypothetical protein
MTLRHPPLRLFVYMALLATLPGACKRRSGTVHVPPAKSAYDTAPLRVEAFEQDPNVRRHIIGMPYGEAALRLGTLKFEADSSFVFSRGGQELEQADTYRIQQDGNGNLHAVNSTPTGDLEVLVLGEAVYVRNNRGQLRQKSRRDIDVDEVPATGFASLVETLDLFPGATFIDPRSESVGGRPATRYRVKLTGAASKEAALPRPGPSPLPLRAPSAWRETAKPLDLTGTLAVDAATGVVLRAELAGRLEVQDRPVRPTQLTIRYRSLVSDVGRVPAFKVPARTVAEYRRATHPRDPLAFFRDQLPPPPKPEEGKPE